MTVYKLTSLFASAANADFPYIHRESTLTSSNTTRTLLTHSNVTSEELAIYGQFLEAIELKGLESHLNFGFSSYNHNDVFKGNCPAYFGIKKDVETGELTMGLMLGVDSEQLNAKSEFIPCEIEKALVKRGKREVEEYQYTLNGCLVEMREMLDNDGKGLGKFYLQVEHIDGNYFTFPFLLDKKQELTSEQIQKSWKEGTFQTSLKELGFSGSGRLWIQSNKAFFPAFKSKTFPKEGVMFLAKNGKLKITEAGSHPNIKDDIIQTDWEILVSSHPELIIQHYSKEVNGFVNKVLSDATNIQFTSAKLNNQGYSFIVENGIREYNDVVLIHIVCANYSKIEHSPVNTVSKLPERILHKIRSYPEMLAVYREYNLSASTNLESVPQGFVQPQEALSQLPSVDYDKALSDLNGDPRPIKPVMVLDPNSEELAVEGIPF